MYEDKSRPETIKRLQKMEDHDGYFRNLYNDPRFVTLAETLLDDRPVTVNMQWFNKPARDGDVTPPHQDGFYWMLEPEAALTMWLAWTLSTRRTAASGTCPGLTRRV